MTKYTKQRLFEMMNRVGGMPTVKSIDEILGGFGTNVISEKVDFEDDFKDIQPTECWNTEELKNYLNSILKNYRLPSHKRKKPDLIIHNKVIKKIKGTREIDVQQFIDNITKEPPNIISDGNSKMIKSATDDFYTVTIGLPAYRGLVVDMNADPAQFFVVNTCPGASDKCKNVCYARKGRFVLQPNIFVKQTRVLNFLMNNPQKFKEKLKSEIIKLYKSEKSGNKEMRFRWNDSGDFFTKKYFKIGDEIMKDLNAQGFKVTPYAHTKVADIYNTNRGKFTVNPEGMSVYQRPDFVISFSVDAHDDQLSQVDLEGAKTSEIMFKDFQDLFKREENGRTFSTDDNDKLIFKDEINGPKILKQRVSKNFGVPNDKTLLLHDEMLKIPEADEPIYNVIVQLKGETDISTMRPDVKRTFFMIH